jgi:hypothetical protein
MNIVRCPRCLDDVTIPLRASPKALVRCPLCLEEYLLSEALGGLPPALEVLDGSDTADEPALIGASAAAVGADYGGGSDYSLSGGGYDAAFDSSAPARPAAARPVVTGARPKKKERSALAEMFKIVGGGVLGLALGYIVLLWALGLDVLQLGPKVAPYAPWLVPARFHGKPATDSTASADTSGTDTSGTDTSGTDTSGTDTSGAEMSGNSGGMVDTSGDSTPAPEVGKKSGKKKKSKRGDPSESDVTPAAGETDSTPRSFESDTATGLPDSSLSPIPLPEPDLRPLLPEVNPSPESKANTEERPTAKPADATDPTPTVEPETTEKPQPERTSEKPAPTATEKPEVKPEPDPVPAEDKAPPTAEELAAAVGAVTERYTKVQESSGLPAEVRRQLYTDMYQAASDVGGLISRVDSSQDAFSTAVAELKSTLGGLAEQPGKVSALKALTDNNLPQRKHDEGVLLAGAAQGFESAGSLFACKFQAGKSMAETTLVSFTDPAEFCQAGDELLVVGRVVENPAKNLRGYEGEAERVVLLGYAVSVPKPAPNP